MNIPELIREAKQGSAAAQNACSISWEIECYWYVAGM
jgi:hypothetical protein